MPGIIPMKLIKTISNNQTRIAQACDRCRSKKIRCDGIRPSCSQCSAVGFECKTSDKLSRRAFPRGYTESLEERVRTLETEVRELKDLLDAKDEQIDVLSRLHSFSPYSPPSSAWSSDNSKRASSIPSLKPVSEASPTSLNEDDKILSETFTIPESTSLIRDSRYGDFFEGASSGRAFADTLKSRMGVLGLDHPDFSTDIFFARMSKVQTVRISSPKLSDTSSIRVPPRMISDLLLTSFFQEWHPLFPVLHRPTFLQIYENFVNLDNTAPEFPRQHHKIAQLFLVLAISSSQTEARNSQEHENFEKNWQFSLDAILMEPTMETLQCLVLAQIYCMSIGENVRLVQYRNLAVGIALRLGLNQSQKNFPLNALASEMRKRVFWCVYCLDNFTAAMLGMPNIIRDEDVDAEYPSDIDDEYVSEKGFLPTLPGDHTKISSSIALFRISRMLSKVISTIYSVTGKHRQNYKVLQDLEDELDSWKAGLAPHLRLEFVNGVPGTNIVHSRSPLLVLAYHYVRVLIHRAPIGPEITPMSSASLHSVTESSKCIYQIVKLLDERKLGFAFCLNRNQTLLLCGIALLCGSLAYSPEATTYKEYQKLVSEIVLMLQKKHYSLKREFELIAASAFVGHTSPTTTSAMACPIIPLSSPPKTHLHRSNSTSSKARSGVEKHHHSSKKELSKSTSPYKSFSYHGNSSRASLPTLVDTVPTTEMPKTLKNRRSVLTPVESALENLDLFSWAIDAAPAPQVRQSPPAKPDVSSEEWERIVSSVDQDHGNFIYGSLQNHGIATAPLISPTSSNDEHLRRSSSSAWSTESWNINQALHPSATTIPSYAMGDDEASALFASDHASIFQNIQDPLDDGILLTADWLLS